MPLSEKTTVRFGPFQLDTHCGQLRKDGVGLKLQGQPIQILEILLQKPGQLVTREEIRQRLWTSDTFVDFDHSLNTAVKKLRQTLGDEADTPRYIETLPKRGYRFIGEVIHEEPKPDTRETAAVAVLPIGQLEARPSNRMRRWRRAVVASVLGLLVIAFGLVVYSALKAEPMPRIVGSHVLTKTGYPKAGGVNPVLDRGSLYFIEQRPSGRVTSQVSTAGGESESLKLSCCLTDISRDGSQALWDVWSPKHKGCDTWVQPLPAGTPRLVIEDACWPIWASDGRNFFFTHKNSTELYRANADGTGVEKLATVPHIGGIPRLSPDGSRIRFGGEFPSGPMWEIGADGSNPHPILRGYQDVFGGSWSPDGKYYFFTAWDGDRSSLWAVSEAHHWWKKASTSLSRQLTFGRMSILSPTISQDGKQLFAMGTEWHGELSAYDSKSGKFAPYLGGASICMVDFSRDGQWIAYVAYSEGTLWRSRIDGSERRQLTVPPLAVINPRWSPDGKLIVFSDASNGDRRTMTYFGPQRIYTVSADGGSPMLLLAGYFGDPTWSPDGTSIAYAYFQAPAAPEVRILDLQSQKSTAVPGSQGMRSPRWSPDGKYLVALGGDRPSFATKLMLFSFADNAWVELASASSEVDWREFDWPSWSQDSKFVYAMDNPDSVVRIAIANHTTENIASLRGFRATSYYFDRVGFLWLGLTPDDRPIITRDTGVQEIYAFDLEYK